MQVLSMPLAGAWLCRAAAAASRRGAGRARPRALYSRRDVNTIKDSQRCAMSIGRAPLQFVRAECCDVLEQRAPRALRVAPPARGSGDLTSGMGTPLRAPRNLFALARAVERARSREVLALDAPASARRAAPLPGGLLDSSAEAADGDGPPEMQLAVVPRRIGYAEITHAGLKFHWVLPVHDY
jgi:hypothetical protein